jgi:hypothetical protein
MEITVNVFENFTASIVDLMVANINISCYFNRGIDTVKITALSNHKPGILNNYIIVLYLN